MPYTVRHLPVQGKPPWAKLDRRGRIVSRHKTKKKALASIRAYYANNWLVLNAAVRLDPTRTTMIRRAFARDLNGRFRGLKRKLRRWLVEDDELGLKARPRLVGMQRQFEFRTDPGKLQAFNEWFRQQVEASVFEVPAGTPPGQPWTSKYVGSAYRRGQINSYLSSKEGKFLTEKGVGQESLERFLRDAFARPEVVSKVQLLAARSFEQLRGISASMSSDMNRILAEGLIDGSGAEEIAKRMIQRIDSLTRSRALVIARTEVIHAHAEGQLDAFEELGVEELGVQVEWSTAGDERVCPECEAMEGKVFGIEDARGMIPLHPNCRCAWIPAAPSEKKRRRRR